MAADQQGSARLGIDLGGTKIEGVLLGADSTVLANKRIAAPRGDYTATIEAVASLVSDLEQTGKTRASHGIGMGIPGSISPRTGLVQGANSVWLNGKPLKLDLEKHLGRPVRLANDANCFALSEATDGAGAGARSVFGVIVGTGCGGGIVIGGKLIDGPNAISGEWGHNPLPWAEGDEHPGPQCWCGRRGCMETWVSGPGLAADHKRRTGQDLTAEAVAGLAAQGDQAAADTMTRHASRLARGLASIVNVLDPEIIVLGGGLSKLEMLYEALPKLMENHIFAASPRVEIRRPKWGDASGVRGAAWLW